MLLVQNIKKQKIFEWGNSEESVNLTFIIHNDSIFSNYEDKSSLTLFYGYLDQETHKLTNAQFFSEKLYQHGLTEGLNQCYGSFIVLSLNKNTHKIIYANDALGDFALHYTFEKKKLMLSDLPSALLTNHNKQINNDRLQDFFALSQPTDTGSYFENIKQLSPGCYLTYKNNELIQQRYYHPPTQINYKTQSIAELAEQFRSVIQQAIKWQVSEHNQTALMMSGGMDSTFVAAHCLQAGKQVNSYSYIFSDFPQADESQWISSMKELDINMSMFEGENYWPLKSQWHVSLNSPVSNPYRLLKQKIYQDAHESGDKTMLTGVYADHMYVAHIYWLVDLFKHKPLRALRLLASTIRHVGLKKALKHLSPKKWSKNVRHNPYWLTKKVLQNYNKRKTNALSHPHPQQINLVFGIDTAQSVWLENEYSIQYGITLRHPFRDRRVVEFLTTLPAWLMGNPNNTKLFVKYCAKKLLPAKIIQRKTTTTLKPLFIKGVLQQEFVKVKELLTHKDCRWHEFIKENIISRMLDNPEEHYQELHYLLLWKCISFELWLKKLNRL